MANRAKTPAAAPGATVRTTQPAATATPAQAQPAFTTKATATPNGEASAFVKDESAPHTAPSTMAATKRLEVPMPNSMNDGPQAIPNRAGCKTALMQMSDVADLAAKLEGVRRTASDELD